MQGVGADAGFGDTRLMTAETQAKLERLNKLREVRALAPFPLSTTLRRTAASPCYPCYPRHRWVAVGPRASCRTTCHRVRWAGAPVIPALHFGAPHASAPLFTQDARLLELELQQSMDSTLAGSPKQLSNANTPRT